MLLGFGAQKAGTSWLHDHLARHADTAATPLKEMHFFDCWLRPDLTRDVERIMKRNETRTAAGSPRRAAYGRRKDMLRRPERYLDEYAGVAGEDARYLLDTSPAYSLLEAEDIRIVRDYLAAAGLRMKIWFMMRDPVDRLLSHEFARRREMGAKIDPAKTLLTALDNPGWMARSRYDRTVEALRTVLPEEDLFFGFHEALHDREVERIESWLDLPALPRKDRRINAARRDTEVPEAVTAEAAERLAPVYDYVTATFGDLKPDSWRR